MTRIFVKGFRKQYSETLLGLLFKPFGEIKSIQVNNLTAIVDYNTMEDAMKAVNALQNRVLADTSVLSLDLFYNSKKRIAVKNELPVAAVQAIMSRCGRIYNIKETPAYIFVDFCDENDARKALTSRIEVSDDLRRASAQRGDTPKTADGTRAPGNAGDRYLKISQVVNRPVSDDQTVFVYNIPPLFNENDMLRLFMRYGDIVSSGVQGDRGFVNFTKSVSALRAFKHLDGKKIKNRRLRLKIKGG